MSLSDLQTGASRHAKGKTMRLVGNALCLAAIYVIAASCATGQQFHLPMAAVENPVALSKAMPTLAEQVMAAYKDDDQDRYLNNLFRLQIIDGRYPEADSTIRSLRDLEVAHNSTQAAAKLAPFQIYAKGKERQKAAGLPFEEAFRQSFREFYGQLDDKAAALLLPGFRSDLSSLQDDLRKSLDAQMGKDDITLSAALDLVNKYQVHQVFGEILPLMDALIAEDDAKRYIINDDILVKTPDGASIATMVVRPRSVVARLPALLDFTIYASGGSIFNEQRLSAANGYIGVVAYARGKGRSPDVPVPYEHDGNDARAVIEWISQQPWCDGRVGMFGGSYNGFTQWAAAKHMPAALKAMMPSVAVAPGIDVPMEGNIFLNFVYPWPLYTTTTKMLDAVNYNNKARWDGLNRKWYITGQPYRALDQIDGTHNPIFRHWLDHPSYDSYWQSMIPYRNEFANIDIPILATDGYLEGQGLSSLYYFMEHYKHDPHAEHYYLIGPYNHGGAQRHPANVLDGYEIDPVARIDIEELRYQWFDYIFKGGKKPELLKDKVNYEVMGANQWKHAPSLDAMSNGLLRFHLTAVRSGNAYRLSEQKPSGNAFIPLEIDLADRSDVDRPTSNLIIDKTLDTHNGMAFVSEPMKQATEISGLFSGQLDFITNKKDVDFNVALYELMPNGEYFQLSYYMARAGYAEDRGHRQLLVPGRRQQLTFKCGRLTSRKFQTGSRLVVVLSIIKEPDMQIDYGTGKDVSDESIADAKVPMRIKWYGSSYVDVPVWR
jgi:putative CocE/NonD family hydrolase